MICEPYPPSDPGSTLTPCVQARDPHLLRPGPKTSMQPPERPDNLLGRPYLRGLHSA